MASPPTKLDKDISPSKLVQWKLAKALPNYKYANEKLPKYYPIRIAPILITSLASFPSEKFEFSSSWFINSN